MLLFMARATTKEGWKMKKVIAHLSIGYPTANQEEQLEFPDDTTDEEIDKELEEWAWNYIEIWHEEAE
jgi:hypothetical protein